MRRCGFCPRHGPTDHHGVLQIAQPPHVKHHDVAQTRKLVAHRQSFIELLVVFHKQDHGVRVLAQVLDLARSVGGVDAIGHGTTTQDGQVAQHPFAAGVGQNGTAVMGLHTQTEQSVAQGLHPIAAFAPSPTAPNAQLFLPQPHFVCALFDRVPKQGGYRFAGQDRVWSALQMMKVPQVAHAQRQVFFFFQRRSVRTPSSLMPK